MQYFMGCLCKTKCGFLISAARHVPIFVLFFFPTKVILLKVVHPAKIYQHTKLYGPTSTGETSASPSEISTPSIFEWLKP
jgi:hypothetical protein